MFNRKSKSGWLGGTQWVTLTLIAVFLAGCDPLVSLQGSFWPPWIIVMVAALPLTWLISQLFDRLGIADFIRPPLLIYPTLWALITFICWLLAFDW